MRSAHNLTAVIAACVLAAGIAVVLAVADRQRFSEPEWSPLYKAVLDEAYSRFRESDARVPAGGGAQDATPAPPKKAAPPAAPKPPQQAAPAQRIVQAPQGGQAAGAHHLAAPGTASSEHQSPALSRGNAHAMAKEYEQALAAFREHLGSYPQSALAWHRIADVLAEQGKPEEAVAAYRQALVLRPSFYCVYGHIGDILLARGNKAEAEREFDAMIAGYRGQIAEGGLVATGAKFQLGQFFVEHDRDIDEAITLLEEAGAESPDHPSYLFPLVTAYQRKGRAADALAVIDRIVKARPEFEPHYRDLRAHLTGSGNP